MVKTHHSQLCMYPSQLFFKIEDLKNAATAHIHFKTTAFSKKTYEKNVVNYI